MNFFTESQKGTVFLINGSVRKALNVIFDFTFSMSIRWTERTTQPETTFFSMDFLVVTIGQNFLFVYMQNI